MTRRPELATGAGVVALLVLFTALCGPGFVLSPQWIVQASEIGVVAVPLALLVIAGEFDLSAGAVLGAASMTTAIAHGYFTAPLWLAALLALAVGVAAGLLNGVLTVLSGLPSFLVTLVSMLLVAGATLGLSRAITGTSGVTMRSTDAAVVIDAPTVWWPVFAGAAAFVLSCTRFGNWVQALGGNREAARLLGVPTVRVRLVLFATTSLAAALVGVMQTIRFAGADVTRGQGFLFACVTAVVVGGQRSVLGACLGSVLCAVISAGVHQAGWGSDWAPLAWGVLLALSAGIGLASRAGSATVSRNSP
ncbi:ABC transporter permease [Allokutzneria multivorans]|uniref:Xylose transport system permease protein XylH n=1 Tax=Allokutzneria multivorans TaxID=1142134 RepID=A0ABP7QWI9_9PSEU